MKRYVLQQIIISILMLWLSGCASTLPFNNTSPEATVLSHGTYSSTPENPSFWQGGASLTWARLQLLSPQILQNAERTASDTNSKAWYNLAILSKRYSTRTTQLVNALMIWRAQNPSHPGNTLFPSDTVLQSLISQPPPQHIVSLLPLQGSVASSSQRIRDGILSAYYDYMSRIENQTIDFLDTTQSPITNVYQNAVSKGADFVIGPLLKPDVETLSRSSISVSTLALNYSERHFGNLPAHFYEFGLLPEDEAIQIANKARLAGASQALIIAPQNPWGQRMVSALISQWQQEGGKVQETWYFTPQTNFNSGVAQLLHIDMQADRKLMEEKRDKSILAQQRRQDFDTIFVFASPNSARVIIPLLRYYYVSHIPIYTTSASHPRSAGALTNADFKGVTVCGAPWSLYPSRAKQNPLYAVGRDAYLLSHEIQRMITLPNFPLYGDTGILSMKSQTIRRQLPCLTL